MGRGIIGRAAGIGQTMGLTERMRFSRVIPPWFYLRALLPGLNHARDQALPEMIGDLADRVIPEVVHQRRNIVAPGQIHNLGRIGAILVKLVILIVHAAGVVPGICVRRQGGIRPFRGPKGARRFRFADLDEHFIAPCRARVRVVDQRDEIPALNAGRNRQPQRRRGLKASRQSN